MLEVLTSMTKQTPVKRYAGQYEGQQYVGIDLHRRRSVVMRMTDAGGAAGCGADRQLAAGPGRGDEACRGAPRGRARSDLRLVLGD